jgi:membrane dipeptidase
MDDEQLLALKKNGGVIQVVGFASYIKPESKERTAALTKLGADFAAAMQSAGGAHGAGAAANPARVCPVETAGSPAGKGRGMRGYLAALPADKREDFEKRMADIDAKFPPGPRANVQDFVNHIDYAVKLIGIDHVGISSDFDGGGGIDGWDSAAEAFNVTLELVRRGYTEEQIGKMWSGNLLRVWGEVEKVSQTLQKQ